MDCVDNELKKNKLNSFVLFYLHKKVFLSIEVIKNI